MSAVTLKVTPEKLKSTACDFKNRKGQIKGLTDQMLRTVEGLSSSWEGDAQKTYARKFKALDGDMAQIQVEINEHIEDLIAIAENFLQAEKENVGTSQSLSSDYI